MRHVRVVRVSFGSFCAYHVVSPVAPSVRAREDRSRPKREQLDQVDGTRTTRPRSTLSVVFVPQDEHVTGVFVLLPRIVRALSQAELAPPHPLSATRRLGALPVTSRSLLYINIPSSALPFDPTASLALGGASLRNGEGRNGASSSATEVATVPQRCSKNAYHHLRILLREAKPYTVWGT